MAIDLNSVKTQFLRHSEPTPVSNKNLSQLMFFMNIMTTQVVAVTTVMAGDETHAQPTACVFTHSPAYIKLTDKITNTYYTVTNKGKHCVINEPICKYCFLLPCGRHSSLTIDKNYNAKLF